MYMQSVYPWDESKTWENATEEIRLQEVTRLKEKGWPVEHVAKRIGISIEEAKKYYGK